MLGLLVLIRTVWRTFRGMLQSPETRGLSILTMILVQGGAMFYHWAENLSWVDSYYLTVMTLTTVGYGDVAPQTAGGRIFTTFYVLLGVGIVVALVTSTATHAVEAANDAREARRRFGSSAAGDV